jgi:alkanesulfonate monooxygenase SsuD/methylene tetrahydromethanopterin reductase-like flavin-dependent oxidoreductase (luciferase family)
MSQVSVTFGRRRAAKRRVPVIAYPRHTLPELKRQFERYEQIAHRLDYAPLELPVIRECFVAKTTKEVEEIAGPGVTHLFGLYGKKSTQGERALRSDAGELIADANEVDFRTFSSWYIIGDPDVAKGEIEKIIRELSSSEINLRMQLPGISTGDFEMSLRLFAQEVMPAFQ